MYAVLIAAVLVLTVFSVTTGTPEEMALFNKIKSKISAKRWQDFVKCLNLFNQEIIGRVECCILVKDLLGRSHDLFAKFREFLGVSENLGTLQSANTFSGSYSSCLQLKSFPMGRRSQRHLQLGMTSTSPHVSAAGPATAPCRRR
jgi:hypothetical protein